MFGVSQDSPPTNENFDQKYFLASRCAAYLLEKMELLQSMLVDTYEFKALETDRHQTTDPRKLFLSTDRKIPPVCTFQLVMEMSDTKWGKKLVTENHCGYLPILRGSGQPFKRLDQEQIGKRQGSVQKRDFKYNVCGSSHRGLEQFDVGCCVAARNHIRRFKLRITSFD